MLRVGGEPKKTAGPILRGAAKCRTLQEGPSDHDRRHLGHTFNGTVHLEPLYVGQVGTTPRVPHCEERPGAAHSRRVHLCCGFTGHPSPITGPTLRGAAKRRTLQEGHAPATLWFLGLFGDWHTWPVSLGTLRRYRAVGVRGLCGLDKLSRRRSGRIGDTLRGCAGFM